MSRAARVKLLTPRQREALTWAANGYSNKQIAQKMYVSYNTAIQFLQLAYRALGAEDRCHGVALALKLGEIDPADIHRRHDETNRRAA